MDLNEMLVFARVVQAGSFTAAAKQLGMPKSTVSRKVSELEERLGSRLLQRTTRKLSLTDAGRTYYDYAARIASEIEEAERAVSSLEHTPKGLLRVTAPINAAFLGPIVSSYLRKYPEVRLDILCSGRAVDLVEERYDVGIRAGTLADSSLIARSLGHARWLLVASPAYLKKNGKPKSPEDLKKHDGLFFGAVARSAELHLSNGERSVQVTPPTRLLVNDMDVLHAGALAGLGIANLPASETADDLRARSLERVLPDWNSPSTQVHVVYPSTRHISPKVKSFVDHVQANMTPPLWERLP